MPAPDPLSLLVFIDLHELVSGLRLRSELLPSEQAPPGAADFDWQGFLNRLAVEAGAALAAPPPGLRYSGAFVYASEEPGGEAEALGEAAGRLPAEAGVHVATVKGRKDPGECTACDLARTSRCHQCRSRASSGVFGGGTTDAIAADAFRLARGETFDVAVLVSADNALAPVARFLKGRGKHVVHGGFPPRGSRLSAVCDAVVDLSTALGQLQ